VDGAVFFHPDSERGASRVTREERAKAICRGCPVLVRCREYALAAQEPYGVWGGLGEQERRHIIAQRHAATRAV
jgi:WhiB family redox-sensing transcriptional regulator